jgi:hypothetical protein
LCNILSNEGIALYLISILSLVKCTHHTYNMLLKILHFTKYTSPGFAKQIMNILHILCYNGRLVTWMVISLITAMFKPLIFSMSGFTLSCTVNILILMILCDFCLLPAQFCYIIIHIWKVEICVKIADRCAPWKISNGAQNLVWDVDIRSDNHVNYNKYLSSLEYHSWSGKLSVREEHRWKLLLQRASFG